MRLGIFMASLMLAASPANAQSVSDGIAAWRGGEPTRAVEIWQPLAEDGNADAQFNLAQAYRLGRGVAVDADRARALFAEAAEQGHLGARTNLGLMLYSEGKRAEGLDWLYEAAEQGEPRAMLVYGTALFNGETLERDSVTGYALVSRAAAKDLAAARQTLAEMDRALPVAQRRTGVALAQRLSSGATSLSKAAPEGGTRVAARAPEPSQAPKPVRQTESRAKAPAAPTSLANAYAVQLGAFARDGAAQELFASLSSASVFSGKQAEYKAVGRVTRLRVGPFANGSEARAACQAMERRNQPCFVVAP